MKRLLATVAGLSMLGLAGIANAEDTSGRIIAVEGNLLTLEDGTTYTISEGVPTEGLQPGMEVTVSFEDNGGERVATDVKPAQ